MADQALFAGTHFLVSVFLARHLDPTAYGAFAVAQAVFWLLCSAYGAVVTEPMTVFGAGRYGNRFSVYLAALIRVHWRLVLPVAVATGLAGLSLGRMLGSPLQQALLGLAVAAPLVLLALLGRAACYARLRPARSVIGSAVYCGVVVGIVWILHIRLWLTPASAFLALGIGGVMAGAVTLRGLGPDWHADRIQLQSIAGEHWSYGRWALGTAAVSWVPVNVYYLLLPAWIGFAAGAGLRAVMNFALPALHTMLALTSLLLPVMVRRRLTGGRLAVRSAAWRLWVVLSLIALCYLAALWLGRVRLFDLLYGGKYQEYAPLLVWAGLAPLTASATVALGSMLRAFERPDLVFWSCASSAVVTLTLGVGLTAAWGVAGAAAGIFISYLVTSAVMLLFWRATSTVWR